MTLFSGNNGQWRVKKCEWNEKRKSHIILESDMNCVCSLHRLWCSRYRWYACRKHAIDICGFCCECTDTLWCRSFLMVCGNKIDDWKLDHACNCPICWPAVVWRLNQRQWDQPNWCGHHSDRLWWTIRSMHERCAPGCVPIVQHCWLGSAPIHDWMRPYHCVAWNWAQFVRPDTICPATKYKASNDFFNFFHSQKFQKFQMFKFAPWLYSRLHVQAYTAWWFGHFDEWTRSRRGIASKLVRDTKLVQSAPCTRCCSQFILRLGVSTLCCA